MLEHPYQAQILLMLSGGIDSTYLLYDYLSHTDHLVHAHHISFRNRYHQRWVAEDAACDRIVEWCRGALRDFEYSSSRVDLDLPWTGWDSDLYLYVASRVALNLGHRPISVVVGWCADDLERASIRNRYDAGVADSLWQALWRSTGAPENVSRRLMAPLLEGGIEKADLLAKMPPELIRLTWSCRRPRVDGGPPRSCGSCHACVLRAAATSAHRDPDPG